MAMVFATNSGMNAADVDKVRNTFPFADVEYLRFLAETGGLQIDMYQFFGSKDSSFTSLAEGWQRWFPSVKNDGNPIGEDPSGDCIALCRDGKIRLVSIYLDSVSQGIVLAGSFAEFLSDVLMGPRFPTLFPLGFSSADENEWTRFLRSQKWLTDGKAVDTKRN